MYNKKDILKTLNEFNYFIEESVLDSFIKNWKIDPIYEDEDGVEFFDNLSIVKIKKGISLKSQGYDNDQIIHHINKILADTQPAEEKKVSVEAAPIAQSIDVLYPVETAGEKTPDVPSEMQNLTIDVTSQTLQMLADAVAQKISSEIKQQLLLENPLKESNEALSKKVEELLDDNKKLAERIQQLESNKFNFLTWIEKLISPKKF